MNVAIHRPTAVTTAAVAGIAALYMSAFPTQGPNSSRDITAFEDVGKPKGSDHICLIGPNNQPSDVYTVPTGKTLLLKGALDTGNAAGAVAVTIDGSPAFTLVHAGAGAKAHTSVSLGSGVPLQEGQTVQISSGEGTDLLFGLLLDA